MSNEMKSLFMVLVVLAIVGVGCAGSVPRAAVPALSPTATATAVSKPPPPAPGQNQVLQVRPTATPYVRTETHIVTENTYIGQNQRPDQSVAIDVWSGSPTADTPYICQYDGAYPENVHAAACGPTSLLMLAQKLGFSTDKQVVKQKLASTFGRVWTLSGSSIDTLRGMAKELGLEVSAFQARLAVTNRVTKKVTITAQIDRLKRIVDQGQPALVTGWTDGQAVKGGHFLVVTGINEDVVVTNDPATAGCKGKGRVYTMETFLAMWTAQGNWVLTARKTQ